LAIGRPKKWKKGWRLTSLMIPAEYEEVVEKAIAATPVAVLMQTLFAFPVKGTKFLTMYHIPWLMIMEKNCARLMRQISNF